MWVSGTQDLGSIPSGPIPASGGLVPGVALRSVLTVSALVPVWGALSVGAALGLIAVVVRQEIVFVIMAGIFVIETLSVIIQVLSFKLTGKRVFRMAPIHHHFELKGWPEPKVIVRFWIISVVLVLVSLATLKVR